MATGADRTIRNNEKQIPFDLSAKNPEVGRLLMVHTGMLQGSSKIENFGGGLC